MDIVFEYRHRRVTTSDVEFIRDLIAAHPDASRRSLSKRLCEAWDWRQPNGSLRDMVCRSLMLELHRAGHIELPPRRCAPPNNLAQRKRPEPVEVADSPIRTRLSLLGPLIIRQVRRTAEESLLNSLIEMHHYLGYTQPVGEHLKHLVYAGERPMACFTWSSAPRHLGPRDRFIGWDAAARRANIRFVAYNSRFLILPWVEVPHLASHLLGRMVRALPAQWEQVYGHPVHFAETFVYPARFKGTCYRAANWVYLGQTTGRGKDDLTMRQNRPLKDVLGYPLTKRFREQLCPATVKSNGKKTPGKTEPELLVLEMHDLDEILRRVRKAGVPDEDCTKLGALVDTVAWLQQELDNNNLTVARLRSLFGLSTNEKTDKVLGAREKAGDESETADNREEAEPKKPKKKAKGHGRNGADEYEGAERVEIQHESLKPGDLCPECTTNKKGKVYAIKPKTLVRIVGQAPLQAKVFEMERLRCNLCGKVFTAATPAGIDENKKYHGTAASMIALLKYGSGLPFNRLERLEGNLGIPLPDSTQWDIVNEAAGELTPVHKELIRQAAQGRVLHNDDTSMRVLELRKEIDELEASGDTDRTGIFSTGIVSMLEGGQRVALFFTGRQHAGENMEDVLAQRAAELDKPVQMCDGLGHNLPKEFETIVANCLVHARRKFVEVVNSFPDECRHVLETLRDVYKHDATTRKRDLTDEERLSYHQDHSGPLMDGLKTWMHEQINQKLVEPNSSLGKAIGYMTKRWDRLTLFLRTPGAPLDNNIAERALKKAILNRKNAYFYKTEHGARVGDLFMSLIHSAELVGANAFEYLAALLQHSGDAQRDPGRWMPWNYTAPLAERGDAATST